MPLNNITKIIDSKYLEQLIHLPLLFLEPFGEDVFCVSPALAPASEVRRGIIDRFGDALDEIELDDFFTIDEDAAVVLELAAENDAFLLVTSEVVLE